MASVQSSRASKYARRGVSEDEPVDHVVSAGELLIKQLVQKQTNPQLTLDQQLREEKKFERGIGFVSLDELGSGSSTLQEFEKRKRQAERLGELETRGLSKQEALTLMRNVQRSKATPEAQAVSQQYLNQQPRPQPDPQSSQQIQAGKRQEQELALSVKPDSVETRLYQFALSNESSRTQNCILQPPDHPIHELAAMERSLICFADPQTAARTIRRKRRQQVEAMAEPPHVLYKPPDRQQSLWDAIESPVVVDKNPCPLKRTVTCHRQTFYTIREGEIIKLESKDLKEKPEATLSKLKPTGQAFVSLDKTNNCPEICGKLSEEQIKQMPRFQNYDRGKESKTLYIKNLSRDVTESDLAAVFGQFQESNEDNIIFRLMSGKMRGQAFLTFQCCSNAKAALEVMNGSIVKGNPIIIQYGKQQN